MKRKERGPRTKVKYFQDLEDSYGRREKEELVLGCKCT